MELFLCPSKCLHGILSKGTVACHNDYVIMLLIIFLCCLTHLTSSTQAGVGKRFQSPQQFFECYLLPPPVLMFNTEVLILQCYWS